MPLEKLYDHLKRQMDPDLKFDLNAKADDATHTPRGHKQSLILCN